MFRFCTRHKNIPADKESASTMQYSSLCLPLSLSNRGTLQHGKAAKHSERNNGAGSMLPFTGHHIEVSDSRQAWAPWQTAWITNICSQNNSVPQSLLQ